MNPPSTVMPLTVRRTRMKVPVPRRDWPEFLTPAEVADILRLTEPTVRRLLNTGRMPHIKINRTLRVERAALEAWVKDHLRG